MANPLRFWLILANRFLTGVRSVVAISAGLGKMSPVRIFAGSEYDGLERSLALHRLATRSKLG